ncbi:MAG: hypothetical protein ABH859_03005 [Pseudomonadota bacterium]
MVWEKILRPFTRLEIEQAGQPVDLQIKNAQDLRTCHEEQQIVHRASANPTTFHQDHYIRVETNLRKFGFDSVRVFAENSLTNQPQTLFRTTTVSNRKPSLRNTSSLGVQVYLGSFSGNRQREIAIIDQDGNVGVFEWNPLG